MNWWQSGVFLKLKADIGFCIFVEQEIEVEDSVVSHREGARKMTPHKLDACRKETKKFQEYMLEPYESLCAWEVIMAKTKKGSSEILL